MSSQVEFHELYHKLVLSRANDAPHDAVVPYFRRNYLRLLPRDRQVSILDFGCGMGHMLYYLRAEGYTELHGFDVSPDNVAFCRKHCDAKLHCGNEGLGFLRANPGRFDVVICRDVIEHIPVESLPDYAKALHGALRVSGVAIVETENSVIPSGVYVHAKDITHRRMFTEESLVQFLQYGGFESAEVIPNLPGRSVKARMFAVARALSLLPWRLLLKIDRAGATPRVFSQKIIGVGVKDRAQ